VVDANVRIYVQEVRAVHTVATDGGMRPAVRLPGMRRAFSPCHPDAPGLPHDVAEERQQGVKYERIIERYDGHEPPPYVRPPRSSKKAPRPQAKSVSASLTDLAGDVWLLVQARCWAARTGSRRFVFHPFWSPPSRRRMIAHEDSKRKPSPTIVRTGFRLGKARGEHNESGVPQKAEVVGTLGHFRVGPQPDSCTAANSAHECAYSITSSARLSMIGGMVVLLEHRELQPVGNSGSPLLASTRSASRNTGEWPDKVGLATVKCAGDLACGHRAIRRSSRMRPAGRDRPGLYVPDRPSSDDRRQDRSAFHGRQADLVGPFRPCCARRIWSKPTSGEPLLPTG